MEAAEAFQRQRLTPSDIKLVKRAEKKALAPARTIVRMPKKTTFRRKLGLAALPAIALVPRTRARPLQPVGFKAPAAQRPIKGHNTPTPTPGVKLSRLPPQTRHKALCDAKAERRAIILANGTHKNPRKGKRSQVKC